MTEAKGGFNAGVDGALAFDDFEKQELARIKADIDQGESLIETLNGKEKLFGLIKDRSTKITEDVRKTNPKFKDICGYDPRLSWTKEEFAYWSSTDNGQAVLDGRAKLGPPSSTVDAGGKDVMVNGVSHDEENDDEDPESEDDDPVPTKGGVCVKNRCARHGKWAKMQLAEVRFEQDLVMRRIERLQRELQMSVVRSRQRFLRSGTQSSHCQIYAAPTSKFFEDCSSSDRAEAHHINLRQDLSLEPKGVTQNVFLSSFNLPRP